MPSGAHQNMITDRPRTAVGKANGMSRRVSRAFLPLNSFLTMTHAMGRPAATSIAVTMSAIEKELATAPRISAMTMPSSKMPLISPQSVKSFVTTKIEGTTMMQTNTVRARTNQARRTSLLSETPLIPSTMPIVSARYPASAQGARLSRACPGVVMAISTSRTMGTVF